MVRHGLTEFPGQIIVTEDLLLTYEDFADYLGREPDLYATELLHENYQILDDATAVSEPGLTETAQRVFLDLLKQPPQKSTIPFTANLEVHLYLDRTVERLNANRAALARIVILHGMAIEIESERFKV